MDDITKIHLILCAGIVIILWVLAENNRVLKDIRGYMAEIWMFMRTAASFEKENDEDDQGTG